MNDRTRHILRELELAIQRKANEHIDKTDVTRAELLRWAAQVRLAASEHDA